MRSRQLSPNRQSVLDWAGLRLRRAKADFYIKVKQDVMSSAVCFFCGLLGVWMAPFQSSVRFSQCAVDAWDQKQLHAIFLIRLN